MATKRDDVDRKLDGKLETKMARIRERQAYLQRLIAELQVAVRELQEREPPKDTARTRGARKRRKQADGT